MFKGVGKGSPSRSSPSRGSPAKPSKSSTNDLAVLIGRMQTNADQVEKDILETQARLSQDVSNQQKNKAFEFQAENARNLKEAETLLKDLFLDVDRAKRLKHPQANEIEKDIQQLHDRTTQLCAEYRALYEKLNIPDVGPRVDWAKILDQKMKQVSAGQYGPGISELEKQIAEHNILQKEIEAYGLQIKNIRCGDVADLKSQYKDLLKASIWRGQSLGSLYHHLQGCTKELGYLTEQQTRILKQDWSDQMMDVQSVRREYEDFKSKELLSQEEFVNNLQDDGDRMIELKHPAVRPIQAHQEALKNEWQNFLNLCICQESQLKSVENYKKFQDDAEAVSLSLTKMNSDLDTKYSKFNKDSPGMVSDLLLQLENEEKAVKQAEKSIADLKRRSKEISPLKLRRMRPSQPLSLDTLCDWDAGEVQLTRGDKYILKDNSNPEMWVVQSSTGVIQEAPAACFSIPPPDPESIDKVNRLEGELSAVKQKRAAVQSTLRRSHKETVQPSQQALSTSPPVVQDDPQADQLLGSLDRVDKDLGQVEKEVLNRVRSPVSYSDPTDDLARRIKHQQETTKRLETLGAAKDALQKECETFLSKKPTSTSASQLPVTLNALRSKYSDVNMLSSLYNEKAKAALNLETQIENTDKIISTFEAKLAQDSIIPASPNALQDRANDLQKMKRDLVAQEECVLKLNRGLKDAEHSCSAVQNNFQEYCPDLPRQKREVQLLNDRYHAVADQLDQREKTLRNISLTYQQFQNSNENLMFWMNNLPKHQVKTTDGPSQINYKLQAQKRLVEEIESKEPEKNAVVRLSRNVQATLNDYELQAGKYSSSLDPTLTDFAAKRLRVTPLQESIQAQENDVTKLYMELAAENKQRLHWLEFAKKIVEKPMADEPTSPKKAKSILERNNLENWSPSPEWTTVRVIPEEEMTEHNLLAIRVMVTSDASSSELESDFNGDSSNSEVGEGETSLLEVPACPSTPRRWASLARSPAVPEENHKTSKVADALQRANSFHSTALTKYQNWRRKIQMNFPLLSNKKPGLHWKESSDSCQSDLGEDQFQTQLTSYKKPPEVTRGHVQPYSPVSQRKEKVREMHEDVHLYVPHCPFQSRARGSPRITCGNGTLADDFLELEDIDCDTGTCTGQSWNENKQNYTSESQGFNKNAKVLPSLHLKEKDEKNTRHPEEKFEQELKEAKKRLVLCTEQQPMYDSDGVDLGGTRLQYQNKGVLGISEEDTDWRKGVFKQFADDVPLALPVDIKGALKNPDTAAKEPTAGQPKSPLRLIANAIKRSILEPLTSSTEGLKQDSDSKSKASSEQAYFSFPSTPGYSLSQRNSNNNRANNSQPQELKIGKQAGEYLGITCNSLSTPSNFSVSSEEISPSECTKDLFFPVYSPHSRPSKTTGIPQKSPCTRMEDVPGLLEKFTFREIPPVAPRDVVFTCNAKYLLASSQEPKNTPRDNLDDSTQKSSLGSLFDRLRSKVHERERNSFVSSLPFMRDRSAEDRLHFPSTECEHPTVRKEAAKYSTSSSDDEFESKPSLTHKAKMSLRRRRKLEKETKQLIKQEELKRLHKAQAVQRQLEELEERQRALEIFGVKLERELRGESDTGTQDETQMLHEWFELVLEKNKLMRYESELLIVAQELELEDHQSRLEQKLREKMAVDDSLKDEMDLNEEDEIFTEMMKVVEERDKLVSALEEQRVKEKAEDRHFESIILSRGCQLSGI